MVKSNKERQAAYRARRPFAGEDGNGERRVSMYVSTRAALALDRLARHHSVTKRQMMEQLLIAEDDKILAKLDLGTDAWNEYFGN
ncbi:hypothetical protein [Nitrosomonas communis]|uniref:hypothetical protein n=1 Tax=Nitrosomonas communis TaxID=44574 RepID=UPI0026F0EDCF|nr:hypothetical protein [Nitrosomonas communis]MCO6427137.1 hypothetical protein [Nitrosomonas communis]